MKKLWNNLWYWALKEWFVANFRKEIILYKVYVKKGKIREWRLFDAEGNRLNFND